MARKCSVYINNEGSCALNGTHSSSSSNSSIDSMVPIAPLSTSDGAKLISDPTGNGQGRGITTSGANKDTEEFTKTLLTSVSFQVHTSKGDKTQTLSVNKNIANEVKTIFDQIFTKTKFKIDDIGCYCHRDTQGGPGTGGRLSYHSYGIAIDLNAGHNPYKSNHYNKCDICGSIDGNNLQDDRHVRSENHEVVRIFKNNGWYWGGSWRTPDYMHFCKLNG